MDATLLDWIFWGILAVACVAVWFGVRDKLQVNVWSYKPKRPLLIIDFPPLKTLQKMFFGGLFLFLGFVVLIAAFAINAMD